MFTIIGGDGKEYGPATAEQLRQWITAGRANLDTKAKALGTDEWRRLGDFAEFSGGDVPPPLAGTPPPVPAGAPAAGPVTADRGRRFLGALADGFLEMLCWLPSSIIMMSTMLRMMADNATPDPEEVMKVFWGSIGHSLPYLIALVLLQAALLTIRSQSVGNLLTGTRIVRVSDGEPGGFLRAFLLRGFLARCLRQIPVVGGLFWLVDCCFIFREDRRCLHDLIAGTRVVKV